MVIINLVGSKEIQLFSTCLIRGAKEENKKLEKYVHTDMYKDIFQAFRFNDLVSKIHLNSRAVVQVEELEITIDKRTALIVRNMIELIRDEMPEKILKIDEENINADKIEKQHEELFDRLDNLKDKITQAIK